MTMFQIYGVAADGTCTHAGTRKCQRFGQATARREQREWERWRDNYCDERPDEDFPLKQQRNVATVELRVHPVGYPELRRAFPIKAKGASR